MSYKHKTHAVDAEGKIISNADIDFYIDDVSPFKHLSQIYLYASILAHIIYCIKLVVESRWHLCNHAFVYYTSAIFKNVRCEVLGHAFDF